MTDSLRKTIQKHNSCIGFTSTAPSHLYLDTLFLYICGFNGCHNLLLYIERAQKEEQNRTISNEVQGTKACENYDKRIISELDIKHY